MKIVFFGTSAFAIPSLEKIAASPHEITLLVTQPDRKKGRSLKLKPPAIKESASGLDIPVLQTDNASGKEAAEAIKKLDADLFIVVAFGQLLSEELLGIPKKFAVNLHASLLPKYRGAAPINWAITNGEKTTGVTIFRLNKKLDAGDTILSKSTDIGAEENAVTLSDRLARLGADALAESLDMIENGRAAFEKQDEGRVSFAPKLKKKDGLLDWGLVAARLHDRVRGLAPWPSAFTNLNGKMLKVLESQALGCAVNEARPGQVMDTSHPAGILVKAGQGCLALRRLQLEAARPMGFAEFLRGHKLKAGDLLG